MSALETSIELDNEQTVLELQNSLSVSRRVQWQNIVSKYSQCFNDESINFDSLIEEFEDNNNSDESMDVTDSSGSDDEEEVIPKNKSILEMSHRWVNICKRMDTTGVCNVCNAIITSCSKSVVEDNTVNNSKNESNSLKSTSSSKPLTSKAPSSPKASGSKPSSSNASNSLSASNCDDLIHEDDTELMEHYVRETNCEFSATQLNAIKRTIESKVGDALKNVGFRLNSLECEEDHELRRKVKEELINLLELLVVDVSIKSLCVYGEFESWKRDMF